MICSGSRMISAIFLALPLLCVAVGMPLLGSEDLSSYRGLHLGMSLSAAAKQAGTKASDAKTLHLRPGLIQEIEWQPRPVGLSDPVKADPVKAAVLCFFNGELFRIVVTYDHYKIEGMTSDDMVQAISLTYGTATRPEAEVANISEDVKSAPVIARWEGVDYSYDLVRTGDHSSFSMVLYSKRLDALAQASIVEAIRLDALEGPQREIDKQNKLDDEERVSLERARLINKPNFKP